MSTFDPILARAELKKFEIILAHNLRRIRIACDYETAEKFHDTLEDLREKAVRTMGKTSQVRRASGKIKLHK